MLVQKNNLVLILAGCCLLLFLAAVAQKACGQGATKTPAATPAKSNQKTPAGSATPSPTVTASPSASPAATATKPSTSEENLLVPETSPSPAAKTSSEENLLVPETNPSPGTKSSSEEDLLVPETSPSPAAKAGTGENLLPESITVEPESLLPPAPPKLPPRAPGAGGAPVETAAEAHARLLVENKFPSASTCATCHPKQFREWSFSQHAYAQMSPVFTTMQATIDKRLSGTNGDFCIRCHTQVGMQLKEPIFISDLDRHPTSREGITCIVCHRVKKNYGRVSGRTSIVEGDIFEPVYGPRGDAILKKVLSQPDKYQVVTKRGDVGRAIHTDVVKFDPLEKSRFCGTCHDVNLLNGFRLEEAFSQFKNTAAHEKKGETCQDCHMGKIPGIKSGYEYGPAAMIGDKPTPSRKLTNHTFAGPDYSVIHPGLFPFNTKAQQMATQREWLQFDYKAGWGTDAFENNTPSSYQFPPRWKSIDDRYDARAILDDQFARLEEANKERYQVLRRAFQLHDFVLEENDSRAIKFKVKVVNATDGHACPTGFDAERANFLQVTVTDRRGKVLFRSGDRDPNGDYRDEESAYVHDRRLPLDKYLFSLQSKFLITLIRGGERVQVLPINKSIDPLPYVRPSTNADALLARPNGARKQSIGIPPDGFRWARYVVNGRLLSGQTPYKVNVKFIAQMIPVNLIADIAEVGVDYNMSPKDLANQVVDRCQILWNKTVVLPPRPAIFNFKPTEAEIMAPPRKPFLSLPPIARKSKKVANSAKLSSE
jgi:hypothetical protein